MEAVISTHAVFDDATGDLLFLAPEQLVPVGAASTALPEGFADWSHEWDASAREYVLSLSAIKADALARIDAQAEAARLRFLTPGAGQALTYQRKEAEARAWAAEGASAATPFLSAEAAACDVALADVAAEVLAMADAWIEAGAAIEGQRMAAKAAIGAAGSPGDIASAAAVDWDALLAAWSQ